MPTLEVPNATIYYETFGTGPLLLFIAGAEGRGSVFHAVAKILSSHFTAVCWDRRGYSRSVFEGSQDLSHRLATDADDAQRLIQHLAPHDHDHEHPAAAVAAAAAAAATATTVVFGSSSGAIVAQELVVRHPDHVKTVIAHEPPCFSVLPEESRAQGTALLNHIYDLYRAHGPIFAMETFTAGLSSADEAPLIRECVNPSRGDEIRANALFWFEFELRQYPCAQVDLQALVRHRDKLVPAAGVDSAMGPGVAPVAAIAGATGKDLVRFVGGHLGYMTQPDKWAAAFLEMFSTPNNKKNDDLKPNT